MKGITLAIVFALCLELLVLLYWTFLFRVVWHYQIDGVAHTFQIGP